MGELIFALAAAGEGEEERPDPANVIAGDPVHTSWIAEDADGLMAGIWQSTPGTWRVAYEEWEYVRILEGRLVITPEGGAPFTVTAGDSFVIRPGFRGIWEVQETVRKDFVLHV